MRLEERYSALVSKNRESHAEAADRLSELDSSGICQRETLGDSGRREFLAAADHGVDASRLSADEVKERVRQLYQSAKTIYATKRQALVRVGALVCFCNRYGVATYLLPLHGLRSVPGYDCHLPESIGAVIDDHEGREPLYNYTACKQ